MKRRERSAPIWLFSFVDLAFLLLIALTQVTTDTAKSQIDVALLELPRIEAAPPSADPTPGVPRWQLRVHPLAAGDDPTILRTPFELIEPGTQVGATRESAKTRAVGSDELASRLDLLHHRSVPRPILAPHRDARSEDLLVAVSLLERVWANDRGVTVQPMPPISAKSSSDARSRASELESR
jgi:hypothetical protein